jgi:hypothetical protein
MNAECKGLLASNGIARGGLLGSFQNGEPSALILSIG